MHLWTDFMNVGEINLIFNTSAILMRVVHLRKIFYKNKKFEIKGYFLSS